ncbi:glucosylceramidase [Larkinella ripae]
MQRASKMLGVLTGLVLVLASCQRKTNDAGHSENQSVAVWLTNPDRSALFVKQPQSLSFGPETAPSPTIAVDDAQAFQTIDGFGYTLTGGSAMLLSRMTPKARAALMQELFATDGNHIGVSYLRVSIGASDLDERVFSYDDLPPGQTDPELTRFSLDPDRRHLIPVLKQILAINPAIKILGSPWSPPSWMKTNQSPKGGSLKPDYYPTYARYLVNYIRDMQAEGIRIDAITIQNEPLHPGNNPSMLMLPQEQATFIKTSLGPAFRAAKLDTKILLYDHNADRPDYPISILNDPDVKPYVDGSAFHLYAGPIEALTQVHRAHPDKNLYFTEQWTGAPGDLRGDLAWHVKTLIIGATRNWSRTVLEWNLAADPQQKPHTPGGCDQCLGAVTLAGDSVRRNPAYYAIAVASKFVRPGSVRIASTDLGQLPNVAFKTPDSSRVVIVLNPGGSAQSFALRYQGKQVAATLAAGAVGTYVW